MIADDAKPFPIQAGKPFRGESCAMVWPKGSFIPWWLAEEAYQHYVHLFGDCQNLERIAERGGFGRGELLMLLRRESA